MKKVISLWGRANCGKSSTLNILKDKLRQQGKSLDSYVHDGEKQELFSYRNTLVCVAPGGDNGWMTLILLPKNTALKCNGLICPMWIIYLRISVQS